MPLPTSLVTVSLPAEASSTANVAMSWSESRCVTPVSSS
ncbi:Uncharacterised protein [Mycobacterium tuberculosis]|nr:Uncharacterised protein [Mycobacterium tuberculosis]